MKALSISFGATVLACNSGCDTQNSVASPSLGSFPASLSASFAAPSVPTQAYFPSSLPTQPSLLGASLGGSFAGQPFPQSATFSSPFAQSATTFSQPFAQGVTSFNSQPFSFAQDVTSFTSQPFAPGVASFASQPFAQDATSFSSQPFAQGVTSFSSQPFAQGATSFGSFNSQPFAQGAISFTSQPAIGGSFGGVFTGGSAFSGGNLVTDDSSFTGGNSFDTSSYTGQASYNTGNPFAVNKQWQTSGQGSQQCCQQGSVPSSWQNSPSSVWTASTQTQQGQVQTQTPATPRPVNPSLAGRKPGEQLQITKCRSAQSCEKCRQLNCYWDSTGRITSRCIALGLEVSNIPVEAGQASNLGYCPTSGQQGFLGVNWLAIENSGVAVPSLDGMSDAAVQQWLSSIPNYNPDSTDSNYPAGTAFQDLLPTAGKAYASGMIPSTTPWISFFDSLGSTYNYDGGYSYDNYV